MRIKIADNDPEFLSCFMVMPVVPSPELNALTGLFNNRMDITSHFLQLRWSNYG